MAILIVGAGRSRASSQAEFCRPGSLREHQEDVSATMVIARGREVCALRSAERENVSDVAAVHSEVVVRLVIRGAPHDYP